MANEEAKLFVAGLPDSISEDVLKQLFEATGGKVVSVSLPKDRMTGRPRGFGFVTMATPQEAQAARDALDGSLQAGKSISVRPFQAEPPRRDGPGGGPRSGPGGRGPAAAQSPDRTLYVGNLPYDANEEEVRVLVNGVAPDGVVRVHLPMDADGRKRGFGFVTMASSEAAKTASEQLRTADLRGRRLVVNLAHPKGERPARPEGGYAGGGGGFGAPFPPAFGGGGHGPPGGAGGLPPRKPYEERRKRSFEDGGGPKKNKRAERDQQPRGGRYDYDKDDE
jgi:nucleolin